MEQPTQREQHLQADADSLRSIIAKERNRAQVVLSQKGVLEVANAKLLAALEVTAPDRHRIYLHTAIFSECDFPECEQARDAIEEAKK